MTFVWTYTTLIVSVIVMIMAAACCTISWRRSWYSRSLLWLEVFRFSLILLVLVTLNQPEFTQEIKPEEQPVLVVLHDVSGSMQTQDVVNPQSPAEKPKTRADAIVPVVAPELWKPVEARMKIVFEPFSSQPRTGEKGTDRNTAPQSTADRFPNLRGVVLLSYGAWNTGESPGTAAWA